MSFRDIQGEINNWASQFNPPYWPVHSQFYRLTEEVGEVGRELNDLEGTKKKKSDEKPSSLEDELADVIFTVICIVNNQRIDFRDFVGGRDLSKRISELDNEISEILHVQASIEDISIRR